MTWWNDYVGIPYKLTGRTREDGLDCWGLVRLIHQEQFDIELPSFSEEDHSAANVREVMAAQRENWIHTDDPKIGDVILLRVLGSASHVGLYLGDKQFIHAKEGINSAIERIDSMAWEKRIIGFYRYAPHHASFIGLPNPLKTVLIEKSIPEGTTISQLIKGIRDDNNISDEIIGNQIIFVNSKLIPVDQWDNYIIQGGERVEYRALATNDIGSILSILVLIAAPFLAPFVVSGFAAAGIGISVGLAQTGIMIAGSLLVNALFPVRPPEMPNSIEQSKSQLILQGGANQANLFGSIPVVLGQFRFTPPLGAENFSDLQASDSYLSMLVVWGYGKLNVSDLRLGDTSLTSFQDVEYETINDYSADSGTEIDHFNTLYGSDVTQDIINAELVSDGVGAKTYAVVSNVCTITYTDQPFTAGNSVILDFTSGNGIDGTYSVATASTNSFTVAMVVANTTGNVEISSVSPPVYSGSPYTSQVVSGLSTKITIAIHFPEGMRRIQTEGKDAGKITEATFTSQIQYRQLNPSTLAPITSFADFNSASIATSHSLGSAWFNTDNDQALEQVFRWTQFTLDSESKIKRYDGSFTKNQNDDPSGNLLTRLQNSTYGFNSTYTRLSTIPSDEIELWRVCVEGNSIVATTDVRPVSVTGAALTSSGLIVSIAAATISRGTVSIGASGQEYFKAKDAFTINKNFNVASGTYEIRVRRLNDSTSDEEVGSTKFRRYFKSILYSITGFSNTKPVIAPKNVSLCMTAMRIRATDQLNGNVEGLIGTVQSVCPDYDSATSTWITRPTRNPASLFRYVLQHPANAQAVSDSKINLTDLAEWHTFCKTNSFMFDMVVTDRRSLLDVMRDVAAAGRASPTFRDGKWSIIIDKARSTVVQFFTPHNSWGYESIKALPRLPHAFRVSFNNAEKSYEPDEMIVYNDGYTSANATLFEGLALPGVTTTDQIFKHARFHYAQLKLRPERYSLNVDMEHLICTRGDLVRVRHDVPMWGLGSGRIKTRTSGTELILDEAVPMDAGVQYTIRIRLADGTSITRTVAAAVSDGFYNTITLTASVTATEGAANNLFMYGSLSSESVELIVLSIEPSSELTARLTLVDYSPAVYDSDDEAIPAFNSQITRPPLLQQSVITVQPTIISQVSDETVMLVLSPGKFEYRLSTTFANPVTMPKSVKYVRGQVDYTNDIIVNFSQNAVVSVDQKYIIFGDMEEGAAYTVRIRYETEDGKFGPWTTASTHTIIGKTTPPKAVAQLTATVEGRLIKLDWSDSQEPDFDFYEVRTANSGWGDGNRLWTGKVSNLLVTAPAASASLTWYIKAVDAAGNYSTTATSVSYTTPVVVNPTTITETFADTSLTNATITLDWNDVSPTFGVDYYQVTYTGVSKNVKASTITLPADWLGTRTFTVKTVDLNGNISSGLSKTITKLAPNPATNFRTQVIDNTVMFYWTLPTKTTLPIDHVLLKKGATYATATDIGRKDGGFTTVNETAAGTYTYWIAVVDTDGNQSTPVSVSAAVSEPPDFIFNGSFISAFAGTKSSALLEQGLVVLPVNLTETFADHFTTRSWAGPSDQVTAGYPIYIQPANGTGFYEETFDFGTLLPSSKVTLSYTGVTVSGSPVVVPKISLSADNVTYVDYDGSTQIFGTSFRYVKIRLTVTESTGTGLYQITSMDVQLDNKLISDAGTVSAVSTDASGTIVNFNKAFIDVQAIQITPSGTTAAIAVYDFGDTNLTGTYAVVSNVCTVTYTAHGLITGQTVRLQNTSGNLVTGVYTITGYTANTFTVAMVVGNTSGSVVFYPQSFRVYLFNSSGTRISGTASWQIRGY